MKPTQMDTMKVTIELHLKTKSGIKRRRVKVVIASDGRMVCSEKCLLLAWQCKEGCPHDCLLELRDVTKYTPTITVILPAIASILVNKTHSSQEFPPNGLIFENGLHVSLFPAR
jgi:hypothetical protein